MRNGSDREVVAVRSDGGEHRESHILITLSPYLSHEPVRSGVLLILEYDVCVIIGSQFFKSLGVSGDLAFVSSACPEGLLRHVGDELLVGKRCQFLRVSSPSIPPARSTSHPRGNQGQADETDQYDSGPQQHFVSFFSFFFLKRSHALYLSNRLPLEMSLSLPLLRLSPGLYCGRCGNERQMVITGHIEGGKKKSSEGIKSHGISGRAAAGCEATAFYCFVL